MAKKKINKKELQKQLEKDFLKLSKSKPKKSKPKKKISKTEQKLRGKISYQKRKSNEVLKFLNKFSNANKFDKRKKIVLKHDIVGLKKGEKYSYKKIYGYILNQGTKHNTEIKRLQNKIEKQFKKKPRKKSYNKLKKGEGFLSIGFVWQTTEINNAVFFDPEVITVNGMHPSKDFDKINDELNRIKSQMNAYDIFVMFFDDKGNNRIGFLSDDEIDEIENEN